MSYIKHPLPVCFVLAGCLVLSGCGLCGPQIAVSVGAPALEQDALLYIAAEKNLFGRHGVAITVRDFDTGPSAIAALMNGSVDIAETAELPFVLNVMNGQPLRILVANDRFENDYLVVRKDRGILRPSDLRGKRIALAKGSVAEFLLSRFLTLNGLQGDQVSVVNVAPSDFIRALVDGRVDAEVAWQPFVSLLERAAPAAFRVWPVQSGQAIYGVLVCRQDWLVGHEAAVRGFLQGLADAEDFLDNHPKEGQALVSRRLKYDDAYLGAVWRQHEFSLTLDFSLVAAMEDETNWAVADHVSAGREIPDFLPFIYRDGLARVRPEGVNLMDQEGQP